MLKNNQDPMGRIWLKRLLLKRCKSDYDSKIMDAKTKIAACDRLLDAVDNLLDAISNLTGDSNLEADMASDLIGAVREKRMALKNRVNSLIAEQKKAAR
jgi:uncharacterized protein YdcH (DUF465 family)